VHGRPESRDAFLLIEEGVPRLQVLGVLVVVSLLRPKIIRDLDLSRHGLHVLPLESTLTSLPNGNYLGQWGDHDPRAIEAPDDELGSSMAHGFLRLRCADLRRCEARRLSNEDIATVQHQVRARVLRLFMRRDPVITR
jgi:hypothetical protein